MHGFGEENVKQKPLESARRKGKDNFEKDRKWDGGAWIAPTRFKIRSRDVVNKINTRGGGVP